MQESLDLPITINKKKPCTGCRVISNAGLWSTRVDLLMNRAIVSFLHVT